MSTESYIIPAGGKAPIGTGHYFRLLTADSPVDVYIYTPGGVEVHKNVKGGFNFRAIDYETGEGQIYTKIDVVSAVAQTIEAYNGLGLVGYDRLALQGSIDTNVTAMPIRTIGNWLFQSFAMGTTMYGVVVPASNVNGVRIDQMFIRSEPGALTRIMTKTTTPTSTADVAATTLMAVRTSGVNEIHSENQIMQLPFIVPAGYGIYANSDTVGSSMVHVAGEVL